MQALPARLRAVNDRLQATKPLRVWARLNDARGGILAGGIAYFGFFSLVPVLTVGFTLFGYALGGNAELQRQVAQRVNDTVGFTLIGTDGGPGTIQLSDLVQQGTLTVTGVFGLVVLVIAGLGWLQATREGIRAVFGIPVLADPLLARLRDVASLGLLGLAVLISLIAGIVVGTATGVVGGWLGWEGTVLADSVVWLGSSLVLIAVDLLIFLLFFTVLSGVPVPVADLRFGAFLAAGGMQLLKLSAGLLVHRLSRNPLLASSVVLVGLLVWMNVAARLTLLGAAWAAVTATDRGHLDTPARPGGAGKVQPGGHAGQGATGGAGRGAMGGTGQGTMGGTGQGTMGTDEGRLPGRTREGETAMAAWQHGSRTGGGSVGRTGRTRPSPYARRGEPMPPTFGQRSTDRVTLAAGIVLGAGALIAARAVRRGLAAIRDAVRG